MAGASDPGSDSLLPELSDEEFELFKTLVRTEAGIYLSDVKRALLVARIGPRIRELRLRTFGAYHRRLVEGDEAEIVKMLDLVTTNETRFFREPQHFEYLEQRVVPAIRADAVAGRRERRIRVWSAACSSGEEPYSLAMCLLDQFPAQSGFEIDILGTDISTRVLGRAREALWPLERAREIPERHLKAFMLRGTRTQEGKMKPGPELRAAVRFARLNLNAPAYPFTGTFDVIFCRNVLIYFEQETREIVVDRLMQHLSPTGLLFVGHAETLVTSRARPVAPSVYNRGSAWQRR